MRWLFRNPNDANEVAERERVGKAIRQLWREFPGQTEQLSKEEIGAWTADLLKAIDSRIGFEYGEQSDESRYLALTVESRPWLRWLIREIVRGAPELPGWQILAGRPLYFPDRVVQIVKSRTGCDLEEAFVRVDFGAHRQLSLSWDVGDEENGETAGLLATEHLLGEEAIARWIDIVHTGSPDDCGELWVPVEQLPETVEAATESVREKIRPEPYHSSRFDGVEVIVCEPADADETGYYPDYSDLISSDSRDPSLWAAQHEGRFFHSSRFSSHGEVFAYLKMDRGGNPLEKSLVKSKRDETVELLDRELTAAGLGGVTANGTGIRYDYVDLALGDLKVVVPKLREMLKERLPPRSWLLFFDAELREEWVGIHADGPPPPQPR